MLFLASVYDCVSSLINRISAEFIEPKNANLHMNIIHSTKILPRPKIEFFLLFDLIKKTSIPE